ncbi:ABC transporter ATP-binding protein [Niallia sp. Man26]|uniref:ABC transporter ATP-binding protein n=1 Tax=Niallia sp. Man26 TaxID=2912824 RepID=UPI001EDA6070|nr:ABC transporter ATP-binding protein [Niallia sp. Man26]UPO90727.1 ABC transporter ATP-binding protein [Niallia sp. Man26]
MKSILELNKVSKNLMDFSLQEISFTLNKGTIMGFVGPNGAGKSTTIRCIMDLIHIDSGSIKLFEIDTSKELKKLKQRIGFVYDQDVYFEDLSVKKNKNIISRFYEHWNDDIFHQYIHEFGVPLKKSVKHLSKGTKMKFALAIALSHHAELIIMDEPTTGLDPVFRKELLDILLKVIQDTDTSIFFSTHITTDLEQVADYITFILDGKIIFCSKTNELLEKYSLINGPKKLTELVKSANPISLKETELAFQAFFESKEINKFKLNTELTIQKPTLEEIIYYLVKQ